MIPKRSNSKIPAKLRELRQQSGKLRRRISSSLSSWNRLSKLRTPSTTKVTVITPFFNEAPHLEQSIQSVINQDYGYWDLILLDDGSTDGSREMAERYANEFDNIRVVVEHGAQGPARLRNRALEITDSEYIAFLDADDFMSHDSLRLRAAVLDRDPLAAAAYSPVTLIGEDGEELGLAGTKKEIVNFGDLAGNLFITSCVMARLSILTELGGFDPNFKHGEDWDLWLRMTRLGYYFRCAAGSRIDYRQHPGSLSHSALHKDFMLRKRVSDIAWSKDPRCKAPLPEFEDGLAPAIRQLGDTQRAFSTYVSCLFLGHQNDAAELLREVNFKLLSLIDPRIIADSSRYSILRNAALSKSSWDQFADQREQEVSSLIHSQLPKSLNSFANSYLSLLFD